MIRFTSLAAAHRLARSKLPQNHIPFILERTLAPNPAEIIWSNLAMSYLERIVRVVATTGFVTAMIILWAIPVSVIGCISNINYLADRVHSLRYLLKVPPAILGVITGLLPTLMLTLLMALLPIVLRGISPLNSC